MTAAISGAGQAPDAAEGGGGAQSVPLRALTSPPSTRSRLLAALTGRAWLLGLLVAAGYVALQLTASSQWFLYPDSYRYARAAEQFAGVSREQAHLDALAAYCTTRADAAHETTRLSPVPVPDLPLGTMTAQDCEARWALSRDITTDDPRYQAIFSSRPGYPLLAAPFVSAFGVTDGLRVLGLVTTAGGALMVVGLLRSAGLPPVAAVSGQLVFLATPLAQWGLQALSEGLVTVTVLGTLWGAVLLSRRRPAAGAPLLLASLAVCAVTRYSTALVLAVLTALAAAALWGGVREARHRWTGVLAALAALGAGVTAVVMSAMALPSSTTTLQDTFTVHFSQPLVPDPWHRLAELDGHFWAHWIGGQATLPTLLVPTLLAAWALCRYGRGLGWFALAAALTGAVQVAAHPLAQEADRLGVLMWLPAVLGLPLYVARAGRRTAQPGEKAEAAERAGTEVPALSDTGTAAEAEPGAAAG
ncbi:hypothetical protein [Actinacidiphila bryophytorum]|uniref:hypothetical protein n=1 Tax=Actinacidiphila bryophytorum TaxID=1436133 RepID=UPI002176D4E1|nr:hypothetical protein [Actinacidiphila bryophytorum]UWE08460.1 hypothetical protein NYE86_06785 [Actinacidiphila bryophytorum]